MPRNYLKAFPTAILRRGLAHFHPLCSGPGPLAPESDSDGGSGEGQVPREPAPDIDAAPTPPDPSEEPIASRGTLETVEAAR